MTTTQDHPRTAALIEVRPLQAKDEPEVIAALATALGGGPTGSFDTAFFDWKHRRSIFGHSPGLVATCDEQVVGVRLFMRWRLTGADGTVEAVRAVDTSTHPHFRGLGIFRRLTLELLDQLDRAGEVDLVFNTPNTSSRPGYLKMGWREVADLPIMVAPVRPIRLLRGARRAIGTTAGGGSIQPPENAQAWSSPGCPFDTAQQVLDSCHDEVVELIDTARRRRGLHTPLTLPYLRWRYADAPRLDYRCVCVEAAGRLAGLGFGRVRQRGALREFTLADVLVRDGDHAAARRVLWTARHAGADHVTVHAAPGTELQRAAPAAGYLRVPRHGVGLVANPRHPVRPDPTAAGSWALSLGDLEVF